MPELLNTGDDPKAVSQRADDDAILARAHQQFKLVIAAEGDLVKRMLDDYRFCDEDFGQWPQTIKSDREADGRPCLQIDRLSGPIRQVLNQVRESRPAVQINPVDDGADPEKAEVRQGVIRQIETDSFADVAYLTAAEHQIKLGRGWWRLVTEWDEKEPYQHIRIVPIENPFGVYYDPRCRKPDYSDGTFAFIPEDLDPADYKERFNTDELPQGLSEIRGTGDAAPDWFPQGKVRIAEYFSVKTTYRAIQRPDGSTDRVPERHVTWYLINAVEILDRREIPGPYIPVIPVIGERTNIDGVIDIKGIVRRSKDPQRMVNYHRSAEVELMSLGTKNQIIVDPDSIEGYEPTWTSRTRRNLAYLPQRSFDPKTGREYRPPLPLQNDVSTLQGYAIIADQSENDLRATTGFFDVQGQEQKPEQSGKAIMARARQAELGNSHFLDNLGRAIRLTGLILNVWIPIYYDTPRVMRIIGRDNQERDVLVHASGPVQEGQQPPAPPQPKPGMDPEKDVVDLSVGRYDVSVSMGPSAQTKRIEAVEQMTAVIQAAPQLLQIIGDLYFKNMDWPEANQIAERLKKSLPPNLQEQPGQQAIPPQVQQQMQQMGQQLQMMTQELEAKTQFIQTEQAKQQAMLQTKAAELQMQREQAKQEAALEIEKARIAAETKIQIAQMEIEAKQQIALMEARIDAERQSREMGMERERAGMEMGMQREHMGMQAAMQDRQLEHDHDQHAADLHQAAHLSEAEMKSKEKLAALKPTKPNGAEHA